MKGAIIVLVIFSLAISQAYACQLEGIIDDMLESLRKLLQTGDPDKGIPSFDPFILPDQDLNLNSGIISGNLKITKFELHGVTEFVKTIGCVTIGSPNALELGIKLDKIALTTGYDGNLNLMHMVDLYGTGNASIIVTDFSVNVKLEVSPKGKLTKIGVVLVLPAVDIKITGLYNDEFMSDIISRQLSATLTTLAKEEEERINKILNDLLAQLIAEKPEETLKEVQVENEVNISEAAIENIMEVLKDTIQNMFTKKDFIMKELTDKFLNEY